MQQAWQRDKQWSDRFIPEIKRCLADFLIVPAPIQADQQEATDLMVFTARNVRIGCRIRKHSYMADYQDEFTIRLSRPSGQVSELTKIASGWGDYLFYGFANKTETQLAYARLIDLKVFRAEYHKHLSLKANGQPGHLSCGKSPNWDGSSEFMWFKCEPGFPSDLVVQEWFTRPPSATSTPPAIQSLAV